MKYLEKNTTMKFIVCTAVVLFGIMSCEKEVEVKLPKEEPRLVVNALLNNNTVFRVNISKSTGIFDSNSSNTSLSNATVLLYENNNFKDSLLYNSFSELYVAKNNTRVVAGNLYFLKAAAPGFLAVETQSKAPVSVPIVNIVKRENVRTDADGFQLDEIRLTFNDNAATSDFYLVRLRKPSSSSGNTVQYDENLCLSSSDKDIDRYAASDPRDIESCFGNEFLMTDKNFNGSQKEIIFFATHTSMMPFVNPVNNRTYKPVIELHHITQDQYRFSKSYNTYLDADGNPFAEPVLIYGNIKNGYGIFSAFSMTRDTIR